MKKSGKSRAVRLKTSALGRGITASPSLPLGLGRARFARKFFSLISEMKRN
jgi:hypothetical protein